MQLHLNQGTEYAYRALCMLDESDGARVSGKTMAEQLDVSVDYLTKVLRPLSRAGWIAGSRGASGGYRITVDLSALCVLDLIEAVEGRVDRERCMHGDSRNPAQELCAYHDAWIRARDSLLVELESTPLNEPCLASSE